MHLTSMLCIGIAAMLVVCFASGAEAGLEAGLKAFESGDYGTALKELRVINMVNGLGALFAVMAAVFWFKSAAVDTPEPFSINVHTDIQDVINLAYSIRDQSQLSAWAASSACISALLQAFAILLSLFT